MQKQINKAREIIAKEIIKNLDEIYNKQEFNNPEELFEATNEMIRKEFLFEE